MNRFSCLMSFYGKDDPKFLDESLQSIESQTLRPSEIVMVQDGAITQELEKIISKWNDKLPIHRVINKENLGLGQSLNLGLEVCNEEIVARMDADDICHPHRFEIQYKFLVQNPDISVVGSWIAEFSNNINNINTYRKLPEEHYDLYNFAKKRCPLNHPTVMFKKSDILNVGSYNNFRFQQDYHLWGRMLNSGYKMANIPMVLLFMRADEELFERRGGMKYLIIENKIQKDFLKIGFINKLEYLRNLILRGLIRLMPNFLRKSLYQKFLR
jgi:glycosyltransferase involved in cell wall biosynthesis